MAENKVSEKRQIALSTFWDMVDVLRWSGIPATGVSAFFLLLKEIIEVSYVENVPAWVALIPYIGVGINVIWFGIKRYREYALGERKIEVKK